jgi:Fe-S-cluster containining protein
VPTSEPRADDRGAALGLIAHTRYACRHSGVCCSSDWEIPVEDALHARLAWAIGAGEVRPRDGVGLVDRPGLPAGTRSVLGRRSGRCVFHTAGPCGCRLHAWGGADAKPVACRQFPWIAVHDARGTFASLSHVCPAAQDRLADPARLVLAPLPRGAASFEGLDVRRSLPPALSTRCLLDWDALTAWETQALDACARNDLPEGALQDLLALRTHAQRWTAAQGRLALWIAAWAPDAPSTAATAWRPDPALDAIVRASAPVGLAVPAPIACGDAPRSRGGWRGGAPLIRRYLAARLVACWPLHYGTGVTTAIAYCAALLSVLSVEIARRAPAEDWAGAGAGDAAVLAAIAETDRLVVHLAAPDALARGLDAWAVHHLDGGL